MRCPNNPCGGSLILQYDEVLKEEYGHCILCSREFGLDGKPRTYKKLRPVRLCPNMPNKRTGGK